MIIVALENGRIIFGDIIVNPNMGIDSINRNVFQKNNDYKPPFKSFRTVNYVKHDGSLFGLRLVFIGDRLKQSIIFCVTAASGEEFDPSLATQENENLCRLLSESKIIEDLEYPWGKAYVFEDRKNSAHNLYVDYKER